MLARPIMNLLQQIGLNNERMEFNLLSPYDKVVTYPLAIELGVIKMEIVNRTKCIALTSHGKKVLSLTSGFYGTAEDIAILRFVQSLQVELLTKEGKSELTISVLEQLVNSPKGLVFGINPSTFKQKFELLLREKCLTVDKGVVRLAPFGLATLISAS